ncbi:cell division protein, FtsQ [Nocardia farcinica]|uniref:cell division protein FtsQ/DivIB n=1 Tax=Nocardia farcinica TaxID=37329 RepID=UPI000DF9C50A|nr:FtsQ-type POTRA domain-containing protein [Nocardia farcinica]SUE29771.1 cell division protein, FtsQ [Nocardia farcinica]
MSVRAAGELVGPGGLRRVRLWALLAVSLLTVLLAVAWFSPVLSVRTVDVEGLRAVPEDEVMAQLQVPEGRSLLRVDTDAMARRVAALPKVASVRIKRAYPQTLRVTVVEREAVLYFDTPQGSHLLDGEAVEFAIEPPPPGLPKLVADHPGSADPLTRAAVTVVNAVPPALKIQVGEVVARSISDISLKLKDGRTVVWGGADDAERKAAVVLPLLTREGTVFDVSSPNLVTVK